MYQLAKKSAEMTQEKINQNSFYLSKKLEEFLPVKETKNIS